MNHIYDLNLHTYTPKISMAKPQPLGHLKDELLWYKTATPQFSRITLL